MRTKDENFLTMARSVFKLLRETEETWSVVPKFVEYAGHLKELLHITLTHQKGAEIKTTGTTEDKSRAEDYAIDFAIKISKRTISFTKDTDNAELRKQLKLNKSELKNGHDAHIVVKLLDVADRINKIADSLKDYGVSDVDITTLYNAIDAYNDLLDEPVKQIRERKGQNEMTVYKIGEIRVLLDKMDGLINNFEGSKFELDYNNTRVVIDRGSRHDPPKDGKDKPAANVAKENKDEGKDA